MITSTELDQLQHWYPALRDLPSATHAALLKDAQRVHAPSGHTLFDIESPCSLFLLITDGSVRVVKPAPSGREISLYRLEAGDSCILTVSCLLGRATYPARGVVDNDLTGFVITQPLFMQLFEEARGFRLFVFQFFAERIAQLMTLVEEISFRQMDQRLAAHLVERGPQIDATHQAVADELGTAREVVSRLLKHFADQNWVQLERGHIRVTNASALARFASVVRDSSH